MSPEKLQALVAAIPAVIIAITYHEIAHGLVADRLGDPTARMVGRLSPNPLRHVDPMGTIVLPLMLYLVGGPVIGWAKPVPVNPLNLKNPKIDMAVVAAAGPVTNLILGTVAFFLAKLIAPVAHPHGMMGVLGAIFPGAFALPLGGPSGFQYVLFPVAMVLVFMVWVNVILAVFNLIPVPPLDGGRILVGLLPDGVSEVVAGIERYSFLVMVGFLVLMSTTDVGSRFFGSIIVGLIKLLLS